MNNMIKKIIQEELSRFEDKLYIFDFDETLISDKNSFFIKKADGSRLPMSHKDYIEYNLQPGDTVEFDENHEIVNFEINEEVFNLLKTHQQNAVILTARSKDRSIVQVLSKLGVNVPVFAVGPKDPAQNNSAYNAKQKASWITKAIETFRLNYIEFWDDNRFNIYEAEKLKERFPNVTIVTHLVKF